MRRNLEKNKHTSVVPTIKTLSAPNDIGREYLVRWNQDCSRAMQDAPHLLVMGAEYFL